MTTTNDVLTVLKARGFIDGITAEDELREKLKTPRKVYCGFDPTGESLHVGSLVPILGLAWFQRYGHTPVALVGGATGMIGDPSGKSSERVLLDEPTIARNCAGIQKNLESILDFNHPTAPAKLLNNFDWFKSFSFIGFLRDVGKHFRMGTMLAKDSVKTRLQSDEGLSFTEFSYQTLQGYDFLHLHQTHAVEIQLGGSDQWGNITAGTDLIRKVHGAPAYGVTFPLLTRSDGQKFGKSEKGAIWLSPDKLSPYEFFQYLVRVADADVIRLLKMLTFMDLAEIETIEAQMKQPDYVPNTAQKRLAMEVTRIVHGEEALQTALRVTDGIAPGSKTELDGAMFEQLMVDMPSVVFAPADVRQAKLVDLLVKAGLQPSKGQARRLLQNGGVYLNNQQVSDGDYTLSDTDIVDNRFVLLSVGKKNKLIVRIA